MMVNKKDFTIPFWLLMPLIIMQAFALYFFVEMAAHSLQSERELERKYQANSDQYPLPRSSQKFISESLRAGVTILVLIGESIIFWRIRNKSYNRLLTVGYILPLLFVLVVIPVMALNARLYFDWLAPNKMLYWTSIGIAHLFLAIMLKQVYAKRKQLVPANSENILDDYADL